MASTVNEIVSDPEFRTFSFDIQKQLISDADPTFNELKPEEQAEFLSPYAPTPQVAPQSETTSTLKEFNPSETPQEKSLNEKLTDLGLSGPRAVRDLAVAGYEGVTQIPSVLSNPSSIIPTAVESGKRIAMDFGMSAIERALSGKNPIPSAINTIPELVSGLFPKSNLQGALESATAPVVESMQDIRNETSVNGANPQVAEATAKIAPLVAPFLAKGLLPRSVAAAGERPPVINKAPSTSPSLTSRVKSRISPDNTQKTMSALDIPEAQAQAALEGSIPILKDLHGKAPSTAQEALQASKSGISTLFKKTSEALTKAEENGLAMKGNLAFERASEELGSIPTLDAAEAQRILKPYEKLATETSPIQGQKLLKRLNEELTAFYEKEGISEKVARANPEVAAKIAFRDELSNQLDEIVKGVTGVNESPYRDIGQLIEFQSNLGKRLNDLKGTVANDLTGIDKGPNTSIPKTKYQVGTQVLKSLTRPFVKNQVEKLDDAIKNIFSKSERAQSPTPLIDEEIAAINETYAKSPTSSSLNYKLQSLIPKNAQGLPLKYQQQIADAIQSGNVKPVR